MSAWPSGEPSNKFYKYGIQYEFVVRCVLGTHEKVLVPRKQKASGKKIECALCAYCTLQRNGKFDQIRTYVRSD